MLRVDVLTDPREFVARAMPVLDADPVPNNVVASMAERRIGESAGSGGRGDLWFVVRDDDRVVAAGMWTAGFPPYVTAMPAAAAEAVADALTLEVDVLDVLDGVNGDVEAATGFAARWASTHGLEVVVERRSRLFGLGELRPPSGVPGRLRVATPAEADLLYEWTVSFHDEAAGGERVPARADTLRKIEKGHAWLWIDGAGSTPEPVSYTGTAVPVRGVQRIGPVYTPPQFRGRGYASATVAEVSRRLRDGGVERVCLFTDLANPTSNKIYQVIGFEPVGDTVNLGFIAHTDTE